MENETTENQETQSGVKRVLISFDPEVLQMLDDLRHASGRISRPAMIAFLIAQEVRHRQLKGQGKGD